MIVRAPPSFAAPVSGSLCQDVIDVKHLLAVDQAPQVKRCRKRHNRILRHCFDIGCRRVVKSDPPIVVAFEKHQTAKLGIANPGGVLEHGVEHRAKFAGRVEMTLSTSEVAVCR